MRLCLDTKDYEGARVIFTVEQRQIKMQTHPELRDDAFLGRMKEALQNPSFIYEDYTKRSKRRVVYFREYGIGGGRVVYIKIVVEHRKGFKFIVTAFRPDYVKERGKTKLLYGDDNE